MNNVFGFQTYGYEDMELSTQVLIKEALARGLEVEILDREAQFISLANGTNTEFIRQATRTSLDSYITAEILGNKVVTKKILSANGIEVPQGESFNNFNEAEAQLAKFIKSPIVVKPKTTNFGKGISIFPVGPNESDFKKALKNAFSEDNAVIIENYVSGKEYRLLIIGDRCVAVMHRVPANVIGDGISTLTQLVEIKNQDYRRGEGHKTPLEKIKIGEFETAFIAAQGLFANSVIDFGRQVFLRGNSNISTGGDSVDYTDLVHETYKEIAVKAARAVHSKVCGVDMIIKNFAQPAEKNYSIIELNYNPVLYCHNFPYEGINREVEKPLLDLLGF